MVVKFIFHAQLWANLTYLSLGRRMDLVLEADCCSTNKFFSCLSENNSSIPKQIRSAEGDLYDLLSSLAMLDSVFMFDLWKTLVYVKLIYYIIVQFPKY